MTSRPEALKPKSWSASPVDRVPHGRAAARHHIRATFESRASSKSQPLDIFLSARHYSTLPTKTRPRRTHRITVFVGQHANVSSGLRGGLCEPITPPHQFDAVQPSHGSRFGTPFVIGNAWSQVGQMSPPSTISSPSASSTASFSEIFEVGHTRISTRLFFMVELVCDRP